MARRPGLVSRCAALVIGFVLYPADGVRAAGAGPKPAIPVLFDPDAHLPKPDFEKVRSIRFLTTDDFPPFHFALSDGTTGGFDIDLARAICADLKIACTIQARPFESLIAQLKAGKDDALIASIANTASTRKDVAFTAPYYTTPARFVARLADKLLEASPHGLEGRKVGVEKGTAHEAYLKAFFPRAKAVPYASQRELRSALETGAVEMIFGDGISLAGWLNDAGATNCCAFRGGPFTESRFFGNGVGIAVAKDNIALRQVLDYELAKLSADGTYADLYLKYFPIGFY